MAPIWILMTVAGAMLFYLLRCRHRFFYGLIELAVGLIVVIVTFFPQTNFLEIEEQSSWGWLGRVDGFSQAYRDGIPESVNL
jgi:hypothetical protein